MKIHEYQAKHILERYGVAVPKGEVANTLEEAMDVAKRLFAGGAKGVVVKAQIHAGGRGKGGGVKVAKTLADAEEYTKKILGMQLVTHQTGPGGQKVQRVLIEEMSPIERELYLGIVLDRAAAKLVFMASQAGGMEIEEVAAKDPDAIYKAYIDPAVGFQPYQARKLAFALGLKPTQINDAVKFMSGLYKVFLETDASLLEINPFITTTDGRLLALDCKINFDDNAIFRHKELKELRDTAEEDPLEVEASKYALNYIKLDGKLPGRRRGRQPAADRARVRDPTLGQKRAGRFHQYLRWHSARRHPGSGGSGSSQEDQCAGSRHPSPGRHQCGAGTRNPEEFRSQLHYRRDHAGRGRQGRQSSQREGLGQVNGSNLCRC
jgi:succinyl-CoA synthetase beta subunit